ncbi:hypothetical protein ES703_72738 [subsurface metagenome]
MAWTTPTIRATGYLVTSSDWNTDLVSNLAYLKGQAGVDIALEDDVVPSAGTEKVGLSTKPWDEGHFDKLYAGPRAALHKFIREVVVNWESDSDATYQITQGDAGTGAAFQMGGLGQSVLKVDDNQAGAKWIKGQVEQNNALDTAFNASRSPYYRQEFAINQNVANAGAFIGLRQTPSGVLPITSENYCGLVWTGAIWQFQAADGSSVDASGTQTIVVNTRYVIELLVAATKVECYLNGVLVHTLTVDPTGALEWSVLLESDGLGGDTDTLLTLGKVILQEDLS